MIQAGAASNQFAYDFNPCAHNRKWREPTPGIRAKNLILWPKDAPHLCAVACSQGSAHEWNELHLKTG
jgi:hypothetical protein